MNQQSDKRSRRGDPAPSLHPYPYFHAALLALGRTNVDIAERLDVTPESVSRYRTGKGLPTGYVLLRAPELLIALYRDAAALTRGAGALDAADGQRERGAR